MKTVIVENLGRISYEEALAHQNKRFNELLENKNRLKEADRYHYLILCEHYPVITLGRNGDQNNLLLNAQQLNQEGVEFYHTTRGGDITFHGLGQLVIYPIFDLNVIFTDIHKFLRYLEEATIQVLAEYGLDATRSKGETGVWFDTDTNPRKICAMGVKASRWITMHGLALNVNTELKYFDMIVPCGIQNKAVTSLNNELHRTIPLDEVSQKLTDSIIRLFELEPKTRLDNK